MPLGTALLEINRTARVYKDAVTLYDPDTGREWSAILPREAVAAVIKPAA